MLFRPRLQRCCTEFFPASVSGSSYMICRFCRVFSGDPCTACRTHSRLGFYLQSGRLSIGDEGTVLLALRSAAGVLADLVETSKVTAPPPPPSEVPRLPGWATTEVQAEEPPEVAPKEKIEEKESIPEVEEPKVKKSKKEKKEEKERAAKEAARGSRDKEPEERRTVEAEGSYKEDPEERRKSKGIKKEHSKEEGVEEGLAALSSQADKFVAQNPDRFCLGTIGIRGSAARHFKERSRQEDKGNRKPPEPVGPPPNRHHGRGVAREGERRQRSRSKKRRRGTKGAGHRERGFNFWRKKSYS